MEFPLLREVTLNSSLEIVENLLKQGEDPNARDEQGNAALHCVNYYDGEAHKMVQLLLNYGADMNGRDRLGRLPFQHALEHANKTACQMYIDWGFSLEKRDRMLNGTYELLNDFELIESGTTEIIQVLVDLGVDLSATLSASGETLLHKAVQTGASMETIQFLVRAGISINCKNSRGMTPLHMIRFLGCSQVDQIDEERSRHSKLVRYFVSEGYDINTQDMFGKTVVHHVAAKLQQSSLLQFIAGHGADLNIKDRNGVAALHVACSQTNAKNVKQMIESGCLVDIKDNNKATAFHYTVFYNNPSTLQYLLSQCPPSLASKPDSSGRSPLQWAKYFGYVHLMDIFENYFKSMMTGCKRDKQAGVFPLEDKDCLKALDEVENMETEDFALKSDPNRTLQNLLKSPIIGRTPDILETSNIKNEVNRVMECVAIKVARNSPLFAFVPEISGSVSEGTKCGLPNEFDYLCTMDAFSKYFRDPNVAASPPMFCQLHTKPGVCLLDHNIVQYLDSNNSLRSAKLISDFSDELNKAFFEREIWQDVLGLEPASLCYMGANATKISLVWHGKVYKDLLIDVDIVPALYFPDFWPPNVSEAVLLQPKIKERGIHVVMALHDRRFFDDGEKHFRLSFSLAETKIFQSLPELVRSGYILAKAVRNNYVCPQIKQKTGKVQDLQSQELVHSDPEAKELEKMLDMSPDLSNDGNDHEQPSRSDEADNNFEREKPNGNDIWSDDNSITAEEVISSYFLKNALFALANEAYQKETDVTKQTSLEEQAIICARRIYEFIENCIEQERLPSFFVPSLNLLEKNYDPAQHERVYYGGLEFDPMDEDLLQDLNDVLTEIDDRVKDVGYLRKPYVKMLKGILQSQ